MADFVNLRTARKQAKRRQSEKLANASRQLHGQPKDQRKLEDAKQTKAARNLDQHRIEPQEGE